ncbi:epoxide hydrolase, soluble (sEH) [Orbilia brochopaga]|uniref:Epoxide hydrolase, soluble (SEH) n=1 Tax=Orbilia brochopaga TaxID=3140254 RepID=A0AAV9U8S2_9PEZI
MASAAPAESKPPKPSSYTIPVSTGHEDLLHGVAYDFYGQRIATCSSDQRIKVFDATETGEWKENDAWRAHDANISKIAWAHPSFGQIIASCSFDRTVKIFEEQESEPKSSGRRWRRMSRMIGDTRGAICDISFAPAAVGLKLAYISSDGVVQIQEAMETHAVSRWTSVDEFRVVSAAPSRETETSFCLTYCPSRWGGEQLLVGAMDKVRIYRHDSNGKFQPAEELRGHKGLVRDVSWAPNLGRSYHLIATACKDGYVRIFRLTDPRMTFSPTASRPVSRSRHRNFNMDDEKPQQPQPLQPPTSHFSGLAREISNLSVGGGSTSGRGGGMTPGGASGSGLVPGANAGNFSAGGSGIALSIVNSFEKAEDSMGVLTVEEQESRELHGFHVEEIAAFNDHGREVWRVEWNPSGTVLSSAGDDGKIRLWRADRTMRWKCMSVMGSGWKPTRRREDDDDE